MKFKQKLDAVLTIQSKLNPDFKVKINSLPSVTQTVKWKMDFFYMCAAAAQDSEEGLRWAEKITTAECREDLAVDGKLYEPEFAELDQKLANVLMGMISGDTLRKFELLKMKYLSKIPMQLIAGREIVYTICKRIRLAHF